MDDSSIVELADATRELGFFGNVFIRPIVFEGRGQTLPGHTHNYDHATFVGSGRFNVTLRYPDGRCSRKQYLAPAWFEVPALAKHTITSLDGPGVCFCVFAVRDPDGEIAEFVTEHHLKNPFFAMREPAG